ncbi:MAG TPA: MoaD/ThiS family protein [Fimbriimonadales bacterium]|nr:MoaD/ThiS family protein [Fimbriimonadales bacterium]
MPIRIKLFASLRAKFGPEILLEADLPVTVDELERMLRSQDCWVEGSRIAVNLAFAADGDTVLEGDEVAVIAPVSGG